MATIRTTPVMPMGKLKGQPLDEMTTPYLMWLLSQDAIRFKYRRLVREALAVMAARFLDFEKLVAELTPREQPKEYWKIKETAAVIRQKHKEDRQRREQKPRPSAEPVPESLLDASYFVRQARQQQIDPNDVSDLV